MCDIHGRKLVKRRFLIRYLFLRRCLAWTRGKERLHYHPCQVVIDGDGWRNLRILRCSNRCTSNCNRATVAPGASLNCILYNFAKWPLLTTHCIKPLLREVNLRNIPRKHSATELQILVWRVHSSWTLCRVEWQTLGLSFITAPRMASLSHRKPASAGI